MHRHQSPARGLDADGHLDIVAGTLAGSPFLAHGSGAGFLQPVGILDASGDRIVIDQLSSHDAKRWNETSRCDPQGTVEAGWWAVRQELRFADVMLLGPLETATATIELADPERHAALGIAPAAGDP